MYRHNSCLSVCLSVVGGGGPFCRRAKKDESARGKVAGTAARAQLRLLPLVGKLYLFYIGPSLFHDANIEITNRLRVQHPSFHPTIICLSLCRSVYASRCMSRTSSAISLSFALSQTRRSLPIFPFREALLEAVEEHQVRTLNCNWRRYGHHL